MKYLLPPLALLLLTGCNVAVCGENQVRTDLTYKGYGVYDCVSNESYNSIIRTRCIAEVETNTKIGIGMDANELLNTCLESYQVSR